MSAMQLAAPVGALLAAPVGALLAAPPGALFAAPVEGTTVLAPGPGMAVAALVGATVGGLAGALIPLPAYRLSVPWGKPPLAACETCDAPLPEEPKGWLRWGSACPGCGRRLGVPAAALVAITALLGAGLGWRFGLSVVLVPYLLLLAAGMLLAVIDLGCKRLPTNLVWPLIVVGAALLAISSQVIGEQAALTRGVLAALALSAAYLVLAMLPGANLGLGDVRLAGALGLYLGWLGWVEALGGVLVLPFLLNAPVALVMLLSRRVDRKSVLPFGPAMLAGAFVAIVGRYVLVTFVR